MKKFKVNNPKAWTKYVTSEGRYPLPPGCAGGLVVDCGSNVGAFELNYGSLFKKFICYDVCEENINILHENLSDKNLEYEVYKRACTSKKNTMVDVYAHHNQQGLTDYFGNSGNVGIDLYLNKDNSGYTKENKIDEVESITIEEIVEKHPEIQLLKIDIEGAEYEFLQDKDLTKIPYIVGELHFDGEIRNKLLKHIVKTHKVFYHSAPVFCFVRRNK